MNMPLVVGVVMTEVLLLLFAFGDGGVKPFFAVGMLSKMYCIILRGISTLLLTYIQTNSYKCYFLQQDENDCEPIHICTFVHGEL